MARVEGTQFWAVRLPHGVQADEDDAQIALDFIQRNYTPYDGDASFLAGPTEKTQRTWDTIENALLALY